MRGQAAPIKYPAIVQIIGCNKQANARDAKEQWQQAREKNCSCIADNTKESCFANKQITSATTMKHAILQLQTLGNTPKTILQGACSLNALLAVSRLQSSRIVTAAAKNKK